MDVSGYLPAQQFWAHVDEQSQVMRDSAVTDPPVGVLGWHGPVSLGEWASEFGARSLVHGSPGPGQARITVRVGDENPRSGVRTMQWYENPQSVENMFTDDAMPAPTDIEEIDVDGVTVVCEVWSTGEIRWLGGFRRGESVVVEVRHLPATGIRLGRVCDIEPYLAGWREQIAAARGESDASAGSPA